MYQVAVLEAGSAEALKGWMTTHGYVYPKGMDSVVQEYVAKTWCFVVVKARVGQKKGVEPRPGMKKTTPKLPEGAEFSGAVQAMGFRFKVEAPVVPMRLSAFNPGSLYNIVYALCEKSVRFNELPKGKFETRTIPGKTVLENLTQALPAKFIYMDNEGKRRELEVRGGEEPRLPKRVLAWNRPSQWKKRRDPATVNGKALELFASDLLAARHGRLIHSFEKKEKELLNIGEELGVRGTAVDALIKLELKGLGTETIKTALEDLKGMTLTVIKGDFPREVLKKQDLTLAAAR